MKDVEQQLSKLLVKNKGTYLTKGVAFNRDCPRQMELLRYALSQSISFSGLIKELLALRMSGELYNVSTTLQAITTLTEPHRESQVILHDVTPTIKSVGNFL